MATIKIEATDLCDGDELLVHLMIGGAKDETEDHVRLVPVLGPITERQGPTVPTPAHKGHYHRGELLMAFSMTDSQQVDVTIKPVDKKGQPAPLDGVPEWSTDNTDVLSLKPSADGLTCTVIAVGPLTAPDTPARVTVKADADMGSGTTPIIGTLDITITGGAATTITLTPGTPSEQP